MVLVMGQIRTKHYSDISGIVKSTLAKIGYGGGAQGFDADKCAILTTITEQSPDIARGVDESAEFKTSKNDFDKIGAGDQGMMFGFACDETPELMPLALSLSHKIAERLAAVRKSGAVKSLRPDGKCQVTVEYENDRPVRADTILVSAQHTAAADIDLLKSEFIDKVIKAVVPAKYIDAGTKFLVNPTGRFEIGGPEGDSGLTGRKIIVDTYGGYCPHGGGSFSGKDPTKVDRSAAYMARYICKNIVAASLAKKCELQLSYAIGVAAPVSVSVKTFGTGKIPDEKLNRLIVDSFDMRPAAIIEKFDLQRPIYFETSKYGHFGKEFLPWERTDAAKKLAKAIEHK
jgi:S-adenosylmethionine synthetase